MVTPWLSLFRRKPVLITQKRQRLRTLIAQEISGGFCVLLFYIDIVKMTEIENRYGDLVAKRVLYRFEHIVFSVSKSLFSIKGRLLGVQKLWGDDFAVYASFPVGASEEEYRLLSICFQEQVEMMLNQQISFVLREDMKVHVGFAELPGRDIVKEMYTSVKHAVHMAKYGLESEKYQHVAQFHRLLKNGDVHTLYMPIVSLKDGEPLGWEALARGPENSPLYSPAALFAYAEETDSVFHLEHICRKRALEQLRYLNPHQKMFINLDPRAIDDPFLLRGHVFQLLEDLELQPQNIVFEITERQAITNYGMFRKIIEEYRKKGYLIAVDDAGAGYSSLESIAEIYPDYIKLDMSLIRNIDVDSIKQALLETFVQFAEKVRCKIIAEGIETERELKTLIELGVPYGQGFFLGKPAKGMTRINGDAMNFILLTQEKRKTLDLYQKTDTPEVAEILTQTVCVDKHTKVRQVHQIFEQNQRIECVVVLERNKPVGLIMRFQLYQTLGGQYGIALYYERPVSHVLNNNPLKVQINDKIDEVARRAMNRDAYHLYDGIIVVDENGEYVGIVSVQSLLDKMTTIKLETATFANPLTGLPGNVRIERELANRLKLTKEFVVVYCDLDRFKWFNDQCGFEVGDQIIRRTAELLNESVRFEGNDNDFIGHIGGDDFILITTLPRVAAITDYVKAKFHGHIQEVCQKSMCVQPMEGIPELSISMAGVHVPPGRFQSVKEISEQAAAIKKLAKSQSGTVFVCDFQAGWVETAPAQETSERQTRSFPGPTLERAEENR